MDAAPDVPALLRATCRELVELVRADGCVLSRVIGELLIEVAEYARSGNQLSLGHGYLIPDFPLTQDVIERREARTVSLADPNPDPNEAALLRELGFETLLMLPLVSRGECWGLVELYGKGGVGFGEDDIRRAVPVVERAAALLDAS
jgi:GAF domain-containing protein